MSEVSTVLSNGLLNIFPNYFLFNFIFSRDYTEFLEDLEEDPLLRQNVNVYRG
jgi:hypothetical protein